jgi:glycosyltransferase involved in cell wall biosynthesis
MVVSSRVDEPFGNTAVEAMLAARPVIVSDTSGLREAAAGYESARFVAPGEAAAIASAIESVAAGWSDLREAAERDAVVATERHSTESYRRNLRAAVSRALGVRGRATGTAS